MIMALQGATELPKACFQNISLELIEDILRLLCPMDILSVRQVCLELLQPFFLLTAPVIESDVSRLMPGYTHQSSVG
jgi:hypothetical protein